MTPTTAGFGTPRSPAADLTDLLRRAIELAVGNASAGGLPFGALVVRDGVVLGTGVNTSVRDHDPTAHAEVEAIRNACRTAGRLTLPGAVVVSSCEPCALCHAAAAGAGIDRLVYAAPKERVAETLGPPTGPHADLLAEMQRALRSLAPQQIEHVAIAGDRAPFDRYLATRPRS
jgi:tRNA(Arg) A34 adenosine deaminase TadA